MWIWTSGIQFVSPLYHLCSVLKACVCLQLKYIAPLYLTLTTQQYCATMLQIDFFQKNSKLFIKFSFLASLYALLQSVTTESMAIKQLAHLPLFVTLPFRHRDGVFLGGWQHRSLGTEWWPLLHSPPGYVFVWNNRSIKRGKTEQKIAFGVFPRAPQNITRTGT